MKTGSSPLTRGKRRPGIRPSVTWRLIPAHAGKTCVYDAHLFDTPAHPRSRGENPFPSTKCAGSEGSSPLTRGKHRERYRCYQEGRLIPAHAGKTRHRPARQAERGAHPRSRGENAGGRCRARGYHGSSPLTRGKRPRGQQDHRNRRLIPAHAGKTGRSAPTSRGGRAHPRSRGENIIAMMVSRRPLGSSPLTRGKRHAIRSHQSDCGLIPAHAGKTAPKLSEITAGKAHPRSRGENLCRLSRIRVLSGSSPLTRGKRLSAARARGCGRLIPAHAGKTPGLAGGSPTNEAHPRSRGENS